MGHLAALLRLLGISTAALLAVDLISVASSSALELVALR